MSYFKKAILPESDKRNVPGIPPSGNMLADDYNEHNAELRAIETFLGTGMPADEQIEAIASCSPSSENVLGAASYLTNNFNYLTGRGICCSSGVVQSGRRMSFPYNTRAAFLMIPLDANSKTITVASTDGFPAAGTISILNDTSMATAQTAVEWIVYNGKTDTQFLSCQRGALNTTAGNHGGPIPTTNRLNLMECHPLRTFTTACDARYPAWATKNIYGFVEFGLDDDLVSIKKAIRQSPGTDSLSQTSLGSQRNAILSIASDIGILSASPNGEPILQSADASYAAIGELTWTEASSFIDALVSGNIIVLIKPSSRWDVGNAPFIPVFEGRMGVAYSLGAVTLSPTSASNRTFLQAPTISQSADGTVNVIMNATKAGTTKIIQGTVQYKTFFVASTGS